MFGEIDRKKLNYILFVTDFLCQCGALFLIAFLQRGIWFLRFWTQSGKRYSTSAEHNSRNGNKPTDENNTQEFELNNTVSDKDSADQHPEKSRQEMPKGYVCSVEKNLLQ